MKNIITLFSFILIITSCDVVEGPYNITEDCLGIAGGNTICGCTDTLAFNFNITATFEDGSCIYESITYGCIDSLAINFDSTANVDNGSCVYDTSTTYIKKILIEDFTGHTCPNCPSAARELEAIHEAYPNQIIGVALHVSTGFAAPWTGAGKFEYDFRTKWGTDWDDFFDISNSGLPKGMVNRMGYLQNNHKLGKDKWGDAVESELEKEIDFGVSISTNITGDDGVINIDTEILNNTNGDYNLAVCLTESNIINWQKDGQVDNESYIHNHVLRSLLSDESLSNYSNYITGQLVEKTINYNLSVLEQFNIDYSSNTADVGNGNSGGWNASNMSVIAYIYDNITQEILQVEEMHLNN
jgi:thiol-disulfide isomerase/thioredoxin